MPNPGMGQPSRTSGWVNFRTGPSRTASWIATLTAGKELIATD